MHNFLAHNRDELIKRCEAKAAQRPRRDAAEKQCRNGASLFLDQLRRALLAEDDRHAAERITTCEASGGNAETMLDIGVTAAVHGKQLVELGFSLEQVIRDYADLCQATKDLAAEQDTPFSSDAIRTLNKCVDHAIADAVTEFSVQRDALLARQQAAEASARLGALASELRDSLGTATLAIKALESGNLPLSGVTGNVLKRSHLALHTIVERALAELPEGSAAKPPHEPFSLAVFLADAARQAAPNALERGCAFTVRDVSPLLGIAGNRDRLLSALVSVLQNAFTFNRPHTDVTLMAFTHAKRVFIEVHDHCGGLAPAAAEKMFIPFSSTHFDGETGFGLSLSIARQAAEADAGTLVVKNLPGTGCVFTFSLPQHPLP